VASASRARVAGAPPPQPPSGPSPRVRVVSGPNLDLLGAREPELYGTATLADIHRALEAAAQARGAAVECLQSNHEGDLVTWVGRAGREGFDAVLLNAGGLTHTSVALLDAVRASGVPVLEVHLSNPEAREPYRRRSRIAAACLGKVTGLGPASYVLGLIALIDRLRGGDGLTVR
jgi:3-dehydroquinate dehydratase-2